MRVLPQPGSSRPPRPQLTAAPGSASPPIDGPLPATVADVAELGVRLRVAVEAGMRMADDTLTLVLATLLAGGHLLVEDHAVPDDVQAHGQARAHPPDRPQRAAAPRGAKAQVIADTVDEVGAR